MNRLRSSKGTSIVEAALITPLLLLLTFGICEFGTLFYVWLALQNGVNQGARYGITGQTNGTSTRETSIMAAVRDATPTLTLPDSAFTFTHLSPGATSWSAGAGGTDDVLKVTVNYTWNIMTPLLYPFFPSGQITFNQSMAMRNEPRFN